MKYILLICAFLTAYSPAVYAAEVPNTCVCPKTADEDDPVDTTDKPAEDEHNIYIYVSASLKAALNSSELIPNIIQAEDDLTATAQSAAFRAEAQANSNASEIHYTNASGDIVLYMIAIDGINYSSILDAQKNMIAERSGTLIIDYFTGDPVASVDREAHIITPFTTIEEQQAVASHAAYIGNPTATTPEEVFQEGVTFDYSDSGHIAIGAGAQKLAHFSRHREWTELEHEFPPMDNYGYELLYGADGVYIGYIIKTFITAEKEMLFQSDSTAGDAYFPFFPANIVPGQGTFEDIYGYFDNAAISGEQFIKGSPPIF